MNPDQIQQERAKYGIPAQGFQPTQVKATTDKRLAELEAAWAPKPKAPTGSGFDNFAQGLAKSELKFAKGLGTIGQTVLDNTAGRVVNAIGGKGFTSAPVDTKEDIYRPGTEKSKSATEFLKPVGFAQGLGNAAGNIAIGAAGLATGNPSTVLGAAAQMGGISAAQSGIESLGDNSDYKTAAKNAFVSGLTGAVIGGVGKGIANSTKALVQKGPDALYNNALKVLNKVKTAGKSPASFLKDEGVWGNLGTFKKAAEEGIGAENAVIKQAALNAPGGLTYDEVINAASKKLTDELGDLYTPIEVNQLLQKVPIARISQAKDVVPWVDVDGVRSALGSLIGDNKWLASNPSETTKAAQAVYSILSDSVKKATGTTKEFSRLAQWIGTNKAVTRAIGLADSKYGIGLLDTLSGGGGAIAGGLQGDDVGSRLKNAALGGLAGIAVERGVNSPALKTGLAQILEILSSMPTDTAGKVSKSAIEQLLNHFTGSTEEAQQSDPQNPQEELPQSYIKSDPQSSETIPTTDLKIEEPQNQPQNSSLQLFEKPDPSTDTTTDEQKKQAAVRRGVEVAQRVDPTGAVGAVEKVGVKAAVTVADVMKDGLVEALQKAHQTPITGKMVNLDPKLADEAQQFVQFLKEVPNPSVEQMNRGLELVRLLGGNAKDLADTVIQHAQSQLSQLRDSLGRFTAK